MSRELQHKHTMDQFKEVCNGTNCRASKAMPYHSEECRAEHDALHENRRASPASVPEGWKHSCNALCIDGLELWIPQCPHCGKPAPTPPVSENRKDAERYHVLKSGDFSVEQFVSSSYGWKFVPMEELDAAIDAAMQEDKP